MDRARIISKVWVFGLFLMALPVAAIAGKSLGFLQVAHLSEDQRKAVATQIIDRKSSQKFIRDQLRVNDQQFARDLEFIHEAIEKGKYDASAKGNLTNFVIDYSSDDEKIRLEISLKGLGHYTTTDQEDGEIDLQPILDAISNKGKGSVKFVRIDGLRTLHVDDLHKEDAQQIAQAILDRPSTRDDFKHGIEGHFYDKDPSRSSFNLHEGGKGLEQLPMILSHAVQKGEYTKTLLFGKKQVSTNRFRVWASMDEDESMQLVGVPYIGRYVSYNREIANTNRYYVIFELTNLRFYPSAMDARRIDVAKTVSSIARDPSRGRIITFTPDFPKARPKPEEKALP